MSILFKSLHNFTASHASALSFKQGEVFISVPGENEEDKNWHFVLSGRGEPGYVPRSYVTRTHLGRGRQRDEHISSQYWIGSPKKIYSVIQSRSFLQTFVLDVVIFAQ